MSDSTVERAVHLLANAESAPYFSARMAVVPPIGIPASVVRINGNKVVHESEVLNQRDYPDVVHAELAALKQRLDALEQQDGK